MSFFTCSTEMLHWFLKSLSYARPSCHPVNSITQIDGQVKNLMHKNADPNQGKRAILALLHYPPPDSWVRGLSPIMLTLRKISLLTNTNNNQKPKQKSQISSHHLRHKVTGIDSTSFRINSTQLPFVVAETWLIKITRNEKDLNKYSTAVKILSKNSKYPTCIHVLCTEY